MMLRFTKTRLGLMIAALVLVTAVSACSGKKKGPKIEGERISIITTEGALEVAQLTPDIIYVPKVHPIVQPIVSVIPTYLFAYYVGLAKGLNVDRPRNLAKSVTVE